MPNLNTDNELLAELTRAAAILVITTVVAWIVLIILVRWVKRLTYKTESNVDNAVLHAIQIPVIAGVVIFGFRLAFLQTRPLFFSRTVWDSIFFIIYWMLAYITILRLINGLTQWYRDEIAPETETRVDDQVIPFLRRVLVIFVTIITFIVFLGHFNVSTAAINASLTTLGVGSLAVALAAQATLSDTINGFVIMFDRPFRIGDRIEIKELDTWGDVVDIGLRTTRILTRDHRLVVIPNSVIGKNLIVNHSIPSTLYRVETHVSVAYGVDLNSVRQLLIEAVRAQTWVMTDKPVEALFLEFQDSGLLFRVRCWIEHYVETRRVIDKLNTAIYLALEEAGIEIPFPQQVIHFHDSLEGSLESLIKGE